jgi:predicted protein tyrosine phosphatase
MKRLLFICSQNRLRSPTAEQVLADWPDVQAMSAGLNNDAENPVTPDLLAWADVILVMENAHRNRLSRKFRQHVSGKRVIVLGISDDYDYMQPELVAILKRKVPAVAGLHVAD